MSSTSWRVSRREFLRLAALGGSGLALGGAFGMGLPRVFAHPSRQNPSVDVLLQTSGWPIDLPLPDSAPGTYQAGYALAFQSWLDMNPGVRVERIEFNPWDAAALRTAVAGGTAPFTYPIGVLGAWNVTGIQAAFAEGAFADITDAFNRHNVLELLDPKVAAATSRWMAGDRIFGIPYEVVSSQGFFYNRAHLESIGMDRIPLDWTWQDMREMALKLTTEARKGLAMAAYALNWILPSYGIGFDGLVSRYPIPGRGFNWRWDFTTFVDDMVEGVDLWRGMFFDDQSVFSDPNYWDFSQNGPLAAAFYDERASMTPGIALFFSDMAQKMGKTIAESDAMMSFVRAPLGPTGFTPEQPITPSAWAFSPDLSEEALDKAVSLFSDLLLGDGFVKTMQHIYEVTGDLGAVLGAMRWPYANRYSDQIPGIEGSLGAAAGSNFYAALQEIFAQPALPEAGTYLPAETTTGPGDTPWYDKITRWAFTRDAFDVRVEAAEMEGILNQQASTFPSTVDESAFAEGIRRYYADWDSLLQQIAPDFYEQRFKPFYDLRIAPNFG
ncbi:MAG: extracellular solute-binding protein [Anaerolineae bacterium]|nr:extracellular solute-binding protein [Anaerolineae bacterium]